jgi:hypothetical protein
MIIRCTTECSTDKQLPPSERRKKLPPGEELVANCHFFEFGTGMEELKGFKNKLNKGFG